MSNLQTKRCVGGGELNGYNISKLYIDPNPLNSESRYSCTTTSVSPNLGQNYSLKVNLQAHLSVEISRLIAVWLSGSDFKQVWRLMRFWGVSNQHEYLFTTCVVFVLAIWHATETKNSF